MINLYIISKFLSDTAVVKPDFIMPDENLEHFQESILLINRNNQL